MSNLINKNGTCREKKRERRLCASNIFSYENLLKCYYKCHEGKRYTINAIKFELNFESELFKLQKELKDHTYKPGRSICFVVTKPKAREIFAADFRDRIVHHILVNYLEPIWEPFLLTSLMLAERAKGLIKQ